MKVVRSWPAQVPEGRPHVVDTLPRFVMDDYCYRGLADIVTDKDNGVVVIEWDVATSREDFARFLEVCRDNPTEVAVAPYKIYSPTNGNTDLREPIWCLRRYADESEQSMRWCDESDVSCHLFGLGLTYIPRDILREFLDAWPGHFSDASFSGWHYRNVRRDVPIAWDVRPVHLHYPIDRMV